jgi:hypothetical protein
MQGDSRIPGQVNTWPEVVVLDMQDSPIAVGQGETSALRDVRGRGGGDKKKDKSSFFLVLLPKVRMCVMNTSLHCVVGEITFFQSLSPPLET